MAKEIKKHVKAGRPFTGKERKRIVTLTVDPEVWRQFQAVCDKHYSNRSKIITDMIKDWLLKDNE